MRYLLLLLLSVPAIAQTPSNWEFSPICREGALVGLIVGTRQGGVIAVEFNPQDLCKDHI